MLVVSRGEAALSVLRDQLPEKVRPLTIAILSSERQGLRQVEGAIREIQAVVEESRPEIRLSAIRRCEAEIVKVRGRVAAIDAEVDGHAARQSVPLGPDGELAAALARRVAEERASHAWFDDAPALYAAEAGIDDATLDRLRDARAPTGALLDHADAVLPRSDALPDPGELTAWHEDLLDRDRLAAAAMAGPAPPLVVPPDRAETAVKAGAALRDLATSSKAVAARPWLRNLIDGVLGARRVGVLRGADVLLHGVGTSWRPNAAGSPCRPWNCPRAWSTTPKREPPCRARGAASGFGR